MVAEVAVVDVDMAQLTKDLDAEEAQDVQDAQDAQDAQEGPPKKEAKDQEVPPKKVTKDDRPWNP